MAFLDFGSVLGPPGQFTILGRYDTLELLKAAHPDPKAGDCYSVGTAKPYDNYIFNGETGEWDNHGPLKGVDGQKILTISEAPNSESEAQGNIEWPVASFSYVMQVDDGLIYMGENTTTLKTYDLLRVTKVGDEMITGKVIGNIKGADAKTVYELAVAEGYEGTPEALYNAIANIITAAETASAAASKATEAATKATSAALSANDNKTAAEAAAAAAQAAQKATEEAAVTTDQLKEELKSKGDNLEYDTATGKLYLVSDGQRISDGVSVATGGSGGGTATNNAEFTVKNLTGWNTKSIAVGGTCVVQIEWSSIEDGLSTGNGTLQITDGDGAVKSTRSVAQGVLEIDFSSYLAVGSNTLRASISDVYGNTRILNFTITVVSAVLTSPFDATTEYSGAITFPYIATGGFVKTMHFILDGTEIATETVSTSGRQLNFAIPAQAHGAHDFKAYFDGEVDGESITSNMLHYALICTEESDAETIVACAFEIDVVDQYTMLNIPYIVLTPGSLTSEVTLWANGAQIGTTLTVDRTEQIWSYRAAEVGDLLLEIKSGSVSHPINTTVEAVEINAVAETANLALHMTSYGRSNNEENPGSMSYNGIEAEFTGFDFSSDGWKQDDDGVTVLRMARNARVNIPYNVFASDFRTTGKTIEVEFATHDVMDYDAPIISCMSGGRGFVFTPQAVTFKSEQTTITTQYKEDEHVRITFVVEKRAETKLLLIYINGVMSGSVQYQDNDDFTQAVPVGISLGSSLCTTDLYCIRVYDNNLTRYQVVDNWIADTQDAVKMFLRDEHNNVFDEYGNIVISKLPQDLPYLVIECAELPQYKGDKKTCSGYFVDPAHPERNFRFVNAQIDVQGTSSAKYKRKNYKIKFKGGFILYDGATATVYAMNDNAVPTDVFTMKADVASSEGANNVELVRLYNDACPVKAPAQEADPRVRLGIDGFPIVIFWTNTDTKSTEFIGKYNFNNDKETAEVFGLGDEDESWEILNNTSNRVLWKSADFSTDDWKSDFEARHPEDNTNITKLKAWAEWIVQTDQSAATGEELTEAVTYDTGKKDDAGEAILATYTHDTAEYRLAKFVAEIGSYYNIDALVFNYIFTELFLMVDNRAKNAFPTWINAMLLWIILPYDFDTAIGINNEGSLAYSYELEDIDKVGDADVYNGQASVLYINTRQGLYDRIKEMYQTLRSQKKLSYEDTEQRFEDHQGKWPVAIFNEDAYFKYLAPLVDEADGSYLSMLLGDKAEQRKWWLYNRFRYLDSKYNAGDALTDVITVRGYSVSDITVTPYAHIYATIQYGSYFVQERAFRGSSYTLKNPLDGTNDTEIYIYSASQLASIGDLSGLKPGYLDITHATRLQELILGNADPDYKNENLKEQLLIGNNGMLRKIDIRNCSEYAHAIDLKGCAGIEEVYAGGTKTTAVDLPTGGTLRILQLPDTITNLTIINHKNFETLDMESYANITTLRIENTPNVDCVAILAEMPALSRVRLVGIAWENADTATLDKLFTMRGLSETNGNVEDAVVSGAAHFAEIKLSKLVEYEAAFPYLTITADSYINDILLDSEGAAVLTADGELIVMADGAFQSAFAGKTVDDFVVDIQAQMSRLEET